MSEKFRADVQGCGENVWSSNGMEFDTAEEAESYARNLGSRWFGITAFRVVPVSTPRRETVDPSERKVF